MCIHISLLNSAITLSIRRSTSSNLSLSIQILSFFLLNLKPCNLYLNSVRLIFRCNIYQENMKQNLLDFKHSELYKTKSNSVLLNHQLLTLTTSTTGYWCNVAAILDGIIDFQASSCQQFTFLIAISTSNLVSLCTIQRMKGQGKICFGL